MSIGLKGNADGSGAIQVGGSDAITITTGLAATFANNVTVTGTLSANGVTGSVYPIVSGTAVASTSGTSIDFTSIPSWVKRITIMFDSVSTSGTSLPIIQIGSGSVTTTGYNSACGSTAGGTASSTTGFVIQSAVAANVLGGLITLTLIGSNKWVGSVSMARIDTNIGLAGGGVSPALSGALDRVRITTTNGTDTFDAGSINILYE